MVTREEIYIHTSFYQIQKSSKDASIPLRDDITILVPEIPNIAKQIKSLRILRKRTEKIHKATLPGSRIGNLKPQMHI
jgi:hypothetical protein